jgi:phosphoribosyl 1,2-cyclic phosphodiesterase
MPLFVSESQSSLVSLRPRTEQAVGGKPRGALGVCVLGSGSGGNAAVIRLGEMALLIDAGFGPRTTDKRLAQAGVSMADLGAVCLTHLDQDHFRKTWPSTLLKLGVPVYVHAWHFAELMRLPGAAELRDAGLAHSFESTAFQPVPGVTASTVRLQHDRQGTIGYRFDTHAGSIGYATDLGHAPPALIGHMAGVDVLCIECNYDEHMTTTSPRPSWVNRRNMSDSGHLSNEQSFQAVRMIADASPTGLPRDVVLLHRSSQCNHPMKVRRVFERDPDLAGRITLTDQRRRTRWLRVRPISPAQRGQMRCGF